jgi:hypothetical protein
VKTSLARIRATDARVNAFTAVLAERALAQAAAVDASAADLPLRGMPFAVKNLFDLQGLTTLAGSKIERNAAPATRDAVLVRRLEAAGAVCVGALNMDEYAYGFTTENSHEGPTHNPHDLSRISGGSSGGSAAAVAAGHVPLTLGSDTNGSIRVPASLCGVFGLKPTYGRLARTGSYPFVTAWTTWVLSRATPPTWPWPTTPCRATTSKTRHRHADPRSPPFQNCSAARRACASVCWVGGSATWPNPRPAPPWTASPARWAPCKKSTGLKSPAAARPPF